MTVAELQSQLAALVAADPTVSELEVATDQGRGGPDFLQGPAGVVVKDAEDYEDEADDDMPERWVVIS